MESDTASCAAIIDGRAIREPARWTSCDPDARGLGKDSDEGRLKDSGHARDPDDAEVVRLKNVGIELDCGIGPRQEYPRGMDRV